MFDLSGVQDELNKKLAQGFRSVFYLISKEVYEASGELVKSIGTKDCDECGHVLCEGATAEALARLSHDIKNAGKTLNLLAESIEKEFKQRFPEEDINNTLGKEKNSLFEMVSPEQYDRYHKRIYLVSEMLDCYRESMNIIIENNIKSQLNNTKKESKP